MPKFADPWDFAFRVDIGGCDECWPWTGYAIIPCAKCPLMLYGLIGLFGFRYYAHRLALLLSGQDIGKGLVVDHTCFNTLCCNPKHLRVITRADNSRSHSPDWFYKQDLKRETYSKNYGLDGMRGGTWVESRKRWQVYVGAKFVGRYKTREEARAAYLKAAT